ncbi:MAG: hydroxyisourate hydrolase [Roseovarius sp.]
MSGYLTTHVLDTARGCPAAGLLIRLSRITDAGPTPLREMRTNTDGRTDAPILPTAEFAPGAYELLFHAGDYLRAAGGESSFLDLIPIRFTMAEAVHYHVPLLLSPYGYTTYRGS